MAAVSAAVPRQQAAARLVEVMNKSLNQTLSRTVLTSSTTLMVVGSLFFLGGDVLRGFAFILTIGVIVGTYSSIYVASPFLVLWKQFLDRRRGGAPAGVSPGGTVKKVSAS